MYTLLVGPTNLGNPEVDLSSELEKTIEYCLDVIYFLSQQNNVVTFLILKNDDCVNIIMEDTLSRIRDNIESGIISGAYNAAVGQMLVSMAEDMLSDLESRIEQLNRGDCVSMGEVSSFGKKHLVTFQTKKELYEFDTNNVSVGRDMHELIQEDRPRGLLVEFDPTYDINTLKEVSKDILKWIIENPAIVYSGDGECDDSNVRLAGISKNNITGRYEARYTGVTLTNRQELIKYLAKMSSKFGQYIVFDHICISKESIDRYLSPGSRSRDTWHHLKSKTDKGNMISAARYIADNVMCKTTKEIENNRDFVFGNIKVSGDNNTLHVKNIIHIHQAVQRDDYDMFIDHIKNDKPSWYKERCEVPKSNVTDAFRKRFGYANAATISKKIGRKLYSDARSISVDGKTVRMGTLRPIHDL